MSARLLKCCTPDWINSDDDAAHMSLALDLLLKVATTAAAEMPDVKDRFSFIPALKSGLTGSDEASSACKILELYVIP